ncbi:MAG TPA: ROK family protein [Tepidisphaeraceae bacterium]|nr:ROK family protein [Tepidisphaeraceae bacterium]
MGQAKRDERRYLAVEIGGTKLQLVIGDAQGRILCRWRAAVDRGEGGPGICRQIERGVAELTGETRIEAVGVGFGGPVDWRSGRICCSHQIAGWEDFELAQWLKELTGVPVAVDNDANVAALGETLSGAGRGANPVFYITMGSGVGGGLTVDGRIYHGQQPGECEFGHVRLDRSGTTIESRCSGWAVDARIRRLCEAQPGGTLSQLIGSTPGGEARHLPAALERGDASARAILRELGQDLGFAFSHVVHLLHPQRIVLGGGLSLVGEPLRAAVAEAIPQFIMKAFLPGPQVRLAGLGEDVVPVGALHLAKTMEM